MGNHATNMLHHETSTVYYGHCFERVEEINIYRFIGRRQRVSSPSVIKDSQYDFPTLARFSYLLSLHLSFTLCYCVRLVQLFIYTHTSCRNRRSFCAVQKAMLILYHSLFDVQYEWLETLIGREREWPRVSVAFCKTLKECRFLLEIVIVLHRPWRLMKYMNKKSTSFSHVLSLFFSFYLCLIYLFIEPIQQANRHQKNTEDEYDHENNS